MLFGQFWYLLNGAFSPTVVYSLYNKHSGEWDISNDLMSLGHPDTQILVEHHQLRFFHKITYFKTIFEVDGLIMSFFFNLENSFHGTQNDRHNFSVLTLKSVWKKMQFDPRSNIQNILTLWAKLNRQPKTNFNQCLRQYWVLLRRGFCVDTLRSYWSFGVPWKRHSERGKYYKISPFTLWSKNSNFCGKFLADGAKRAIIWESVNPKDVQLFEISHSPANVFHFVMQCYLWWSLTSRFLHIHQDLKDSNSIFRRKS